MKRDVVNRDVPEGVFALPSGAVYICRGALLEIRRRFHHHHVSSDAQKAGEKEGPLLSCRQGPQIRSMTDAAARNYHRGYIMLWVLALLLISGADL